MLKDATPNEETKKRLENSINCIAVRRETGPGFEDFSIGINNT